MVADARFMDCTGNKELSAIARLPRSFRVNKEKQTVMVVGWC